MGYVTERALPTDQEVRKNIERNIAGLVELRGQVRAREELVRQYSSQYATATIEFGRGDITRGQFLLKEDALKAGLATLQNDRQSLGILQRQADDWFEHLQQDEWGATYEAAISGRSSLPPHMRNGTSF